MTTEQDVSAKPRKFRSPFPVAVWWVWVLFACGNLIDLAVQGRAHGSVVAACVLLLVTGVVYTAALRPRIIAGPDGLTIINPLHEYRVVWAAVAGIDSAELLRVRCEWPLEDGTDAIGKRAISSWAVHSPRRKQAAARMRAQRQAARRGAGAGAGRGYGVFGTPPARPRVRPASTMTDADHMISTLASLAEQGKAAAPDQRAVPPVSSWSWPALAAIIVPALAVLIAVLVLPGKQAALAVRGGRRVAGPGPQPFDVAGGRAGLDRGVHQDGQMARGWQPALVGVEHV